MPDLKKSLPTEERNLPAEKSTTVPKTDIPTWRLDPRSPRKFAMAEGAGRRVYGSVTVRQEATYRVLLEGPNGTHEVASVIVEKPDDGRKVALRIQVDATDTPEAPGRPDADEVEKL